MTIAPASVGVSAGLGTVLGLVAGYTDMQAEIRKALHVLDADAAVRCVVVRGAGERAFCAGKELQSRDRFGDAWLFCNDINYAVAFGEFRKPIIAALKGWVYR